MENEVVCVYHKGCLDGTGALWVVDHYFKGNVTPVGGVYHQEVDVNQFLGKDVYFVDFCYKREVMEEIKTVANSVTVLDHHATAKKEVGDLFHIDLTRSGTMLTWLHFFPDVEPPRELLLMEDYDLWKFEYGVETKHFVAYMDRKEKTLEMMKDHFENKKLEDVLAIGKILYDKHMGDVSSLVKSAGRDYELCGYRVKVANVTGQFANDVGNQLAEGYPFSVTYSDRHNGRKFSLRVVKGTGFDASVVAELFGGGGHPESCGFLIPYEHPQFATSHERLVLPE